MRTARSDTLSRVGRYEIVGPLTAGGMAEILLARLEGPSGFERLVVIKRILPHLARTPAFVDMFLDEARLLARIRHPNVVQVHELGREDGELFLVMEYIEGESLAGILKRAWALGDKVGFLLAAQVIAEACAGLHAAHEMLGSDGRPQHVVHRDVSPQNVMVTYSGQVKVLDFGIAQAADRLSKTQTGHIKGKYEYMSPEQCLGKSLDRRSDVFSLGTLLYELSANRRLFKRAHELATLKAITEEALKRPSHGVPDYPPRLEEICLRALSRDRNDRYATAAEMRRELLACIRELGPDDACDAALGALMRRLFADRIEEKNEMLRRVGAREELASLPDPNLDASAFVEPGHDESTRVEPPASPARRRVPPLVLGGVGVLGVFGVLGFAVARSRQADARLDVEAHATVVPAPSAAPSAEDAGPTPAPSDEAARSTLTRSTETETIVLRVETTPRNAHLFVDGERRGQTPADVRLPTGSHPVRVELRREGFLGWSEAVVPNANQHLVVTLRPAPRTGDRQRPTPSAAPSASAPTFWRLP